MRYGILLILAAGLIAAAGCSQQTINSANQDVNRDVQQVKTQAKPDLTKLDLGTRVTVAIEANSNLPHTIRVDASTTGVRLKGTVETARQKHLAGQIARETLKPGQTVENDLTVTGA